MILRREPVSCIHPVRPDFLMNLPSIAPSGRVAAALRDARIGLEREALRVAPDGKVAQTPHPAALGSALTHPWITTDYSEALLELVTPPCAGPAAALDFLGDLHRFVMPRIGDERLWAASMPCVVEGEAGIPIAYYGESNAGRMKRIYRVGLGHRYGRTMQAIAGVHCNFSLTGAAWAVLQDAMGDRRPQREFRDEHTMGMIRNLLRRGWLVPYLFGASPAVCKTFFPGGRSAMPEFDAFTFYEPFATSLRMSDIGYQNRKETETGIRANYDSLAAYVASLEHAIRTPSPLYEKIGVVVAGEWRQLNANLLQIENEYYSTVRPKQPPEWGERPTLALARRGIEYVELRSLDLDPFEPLGVGPDTLRFLQAFMLDCLLRDSPPVDADARAEIDANLAAVARRGRQPGLELRRGGEAVPLGVWARQIVDGMRGVCAALDGGEPDGPYADALAAQAAKIDDPELTPAARVLREMRERGENFHRFARRHSEAHRAVLLAQGPDPERERLFIAEARSSLERQRALEAGQGDEPFVDYLARYFA